MTKSCSGSNLHSDRFAETSSNHRITQPHRARRFDIDLHSGLQLGVMLAVKDFAAGKSRKKGLRIETKDGDSYSYKYRKYVRLSQTVNHVTKRYKKKVYDTETGEFIRDVDEPLSEHVECGSAKNSR